MWHGAYVAWLEESRVEALAKVGLDYADLSSRGLEMPVVALSIDYRQPLRHGDQVVVFSQVLAFDGVKLPWASRFVGPDDRVVAVARVELVLVSRPGGLVPRVVRRYPEDLAHAVARLQAGPETVL
jgi:acyl-CoA thioester hydrolase